MKLRALSFFMLFSCANVHMTQAQTVDAIVQPSETLPSVHHTVDVQTSLREGHLLSLTASTQEYEDWYPILRERIEQTPLPDLSTIPEQSSDQTDCSHPL